MIVNVKLKNFFDKASGKKKKNSVEEDSRGPEAGVIANFMCQLDLAKGYPDSNYF